MDDLSLSLADEDLAVLFNFMDRDGNGSIDVREFAAAMLLPLSGPDTNKASSKYASASQVREQSIVRLFEVLDIDGDGLVTLEEFQNVMARVFPSWNPDTLVPLFREIDHENSGTINRDELSDFVRGSFLFP